MSWSRNPEPKVTKEEFDAPVDPSAVSGKDVTAVASLDEDGTAVKPAAKRHVFSAAQCRRGARKARRQR